MFKEFKEFIQRGNVMDMAVGLVMGAAFKAIIDSIVADFIMPLISLVSGDINFTERKLILRDAATPEAVISLNYGNIIQAILNFLIIALVVVVMVKGFNRLRRQKVEEVEEPAAPSREELLLEEIRDLLAKR